MSMHMQKWQLQDISNTKDNSRKPDNEINVYVIFVQTKVLK